MLDFKIRTGATKVVKLRWSFAEMVIECDYPAVVLPDCSAVVVYDELHTRGHANAGVGPGTKHLRVLNPDGTLRCRVFAPAAPDGDEIEERWVELPREFPEYGVPWGVPTCDGRRDLVMEVDWQTGARLRQVAAPYLRY